MRTLTTTGMLPMGCTVVEDVRTNLNQQGGGEGARQTTSVRADRRDR